MGEIKIGEFVEWTLRIGKWRVPLHGEIITYTWFVMALIVLIAWLLTRRMNPERPTRGQNVLEAILEFLRNTLLENAGPRAFQAFPVAATLFLLILFANLIGLVPIWGIDTSVAHRKLHFIKSPTEDISFTLAMGLVVFLSMIYYGVKNHGFNYVKSFFKPIFIFFPIHLIDILIKPVSLAFRLFGNIFAGAVFILVLYRLYPPVTPVFALALGVFVGCIQAYLFYMLAVAYISSAIEEGSHEDFAERPPHVPAEPSER